MLKDGIIRKSNSSFQSRVVLARKKDGTKRFCVDYRDLNKKIVNHGVPLPNITDALDMAAGAKFFSGFDLASAFWSIPIREEDRYITAFVTPDGKFEWCRTPFGLSVSPSLMQSTMDAVTEGIRDIALPYLDDLLVFGPNFEVTLS